MAIVARTDWEMVEDLLARLASTHASFAGPATRDYRIATYEPGRRLRIEGTAFSRWLDVEDIRGCWTTFERLGTIRKEDVLDPGRASTFIMALFRQLPGVTEVDGAGGGALVRA
jgi:hypothetical protein